MYVQVIAKAKGISWRETKVLGKLQKALDISLDAMLEVVKATLHPEPYTKEEVCTILEVTADELASTSLSENTLTGWSSCNGVYCPHKRLRPSC